MLQKYTLIIVKGHKVYNSFLNGSEKCKLYIYMYMHMHIHIYVWAYRMIKQVCKVLRAGESKVVREILYYSCNNSLRQKLFKIFKENMTTGNFRYFFRN